VGLLGGSRTPCGGDYNRQSREPVNGIRAEFRAGGKFIFCAFLALPKGVKTPVYLLGILVLLAGCGAMWSVTEGDFCGLTAGGPPTYDESVEGLEFLGG
jgi:hypothetical protein